jgi:hypothetical protein
MSSICGRKPFIKVKQQNIRIRRVAKSITLINSDFQKLFNVNNCSIDATKHQTIIYDRGFFSIYRIFDKMEGVDINKNRIRINYSTGCYLLINP